MMAERTVKGKMNSDVYIANPVLYIDGVKFEMRETSELKDKALELVKRMVNNDKGYTYSYAGREYCVFCDTIDGKDNHANDCIWLEANRLVKG